MGGTGTLGGSGLLVYRRFLAGSVIKKNIGYALPVVWKLYKGDFYQNCRKWERYRFLCARDLQYRKLEMKVLLNVHLYVTYSISKNSKNNHEVQEPE